VTVNLPLFVKNSIVLAALTGAVIAANGRANALAYLGMAYYLICAVAVVRNHRQTSLLLWSAVVVHTALTGYLIWSWLTSGAMPCYYCMAAAGFALLAAVAWWKTPAALVPALLMATVWFAWPLIFYAPSFYAGMEGEITAQTVVRELIDLHQQPLLGDCGCGE